MTSENVHIVKVAGMTCSGCSSRLTKLFLKHPNVTEASVSHETGEAHLKGKIKTEEIKEITTNAGFVFLG